MTESPQRIAMQWMPATQWAGSSWLHDPRSLGVATFGGAAVLAGASHLPHAHLPHAHLLTPVISADFPMVEIWSGRAAAIDETVGAVRCRHNGEVLFATVSVPASNDADALGVAAYTAYRSLFDALQATGYPHLLRIWNSIPGINVDDAGLERYRRFNLGRYKAFEEAELPTQSGAPAACALGSHGGPLVLYCLASRTPADTIENPRQVSAYQYPQQYGPRAPNFSRAALWRGDEHDGDILFISGTASIVGHQTLHHGDVAAQTRETLANLESVRTEAVRRGARNVAALSDLLLKAYVRHPDDAPLVRQAVREHGLDSGALLTLHADICRADLLLEIEAIGPARSLSMARQETPKGSTLNTV